MKPFLGFSFNDIFAWTLIKGVSCMGLRTLNTVCEVPRPLGGDWEDTEQSLVILRTLGSRGERDDDNCHLEQSWVNYAQTVSFLVTERMKKAMFVLGGGDLITIRLWSVTGECKQVFTPRARDRGEPALSLWPDTEHAGVRQQQHDSNLSVLYRVQVGSLTQNDKK